MEGHASEVDDLVMEHKVFRHYCRTSFVGVVNKSLTHEQKSLIQSTPFAWLTFLGDKVKLSRTILRELCCRWVERRQSFVIRCEVVPLSLVDVCLGLGLRVVGEKIDLHKSAEESHTKTLFQSNNVKVKMIFDEIMKFDNDGCIQDFCRLYILLGLSEFLLPNRMGIVHSGLFSVLDDLGQLNKFNWGIVVYEYLVNSLCSASMSIRNESSPSHIHIVGCVYLLQIWALEHLFSYKTKVHPTRIKFPRILNWIDFTLGDHEIAYALEKNLVIVHLSVSKEEFQNVIVKEAFEVGHAYNIHIPTKDDVRQMLKKTAEMVHRAKEQDYLITNLEKVVKDLKLCISEMHKSIPEDCPSPVLEPLSVDYTYRESKLFNNIDVGQHEEDQEDGGNEKEDEEKVSNEESNMISRMKREPRIRVKAPILKTPWITYSRKRRKGL